MDSKVYQRKPVYQLNETVKQSAYTMRSDQPLGLASVKKRQVVSIVDLLIKETVLKDGRATWYHDIQHIARVARQIELLLL